MGRYFLEFWGASLDFRPIGYSVRYGRKINHPHWPDARIPPRKRGAGASRRRNAKIDAGNWEEKVILIASRTRGGFSIIAIQADTCTCAGCIRIKQAGYVYAVRASLDPMYRLLFSITFAIDGCEGRRMRLIFDELSPMAVIANLIGWLKDTHRIGNPTYRGMRAWKPHISRPSELVSFLSPP